MNPHFGVNSERGGFGFRSPMSCRLAPTRPPALAPASMLAYLVFTRRASVSNPHFGVDSERGGFEPPVPFGTQPFQDCTIDHSDIFPKNDSTEKNLIHNPGCETVLFLDGKRGIRTPGALRLNGFRDRPIRPLSHLSIQNNNLKLTCF